MIQNDWENKIQVRKGNIGEEIVVSFLESKGFIIYEAVTKKAHAFDKLAIRNKELLMIAEVKTKAKMKFYPATGFNYKHYLEYKKISEKHKLDVFIFFVDELEERVYGNFLRILEETIFVEGKKYPLRMKNLILFPLEKMREISKLTKKQVEDLKKLSTRSYGY